MDLQRESSFMTGGVIVVVIAKADLITAEGRRIPDSATSWGIQWPAANRIQDDLQRRPGADAFAAYREAGTPAIRESAFALARNAGQAALDDNDLPGLLDRLTGRELDVLRLLATGLTNPQIADRLVIGTGTVKTHTLNIYRKLGVGNRTQAILRAQALRLLA